VKKNNLRKSVKSADENSIFYTDKADLLWLSGPGIRLLKIEGPIITPAVSFRLNHRNYAFGGIVLTNRIVLLTKAALRLK